MVLTEKQVGEILTEIFTTLFQTPTQIVHSEAKLNPEGPFYRASVNISGVWQAHLAIESTAHLCQQAAAAFFSLPANQLKATDLQEAIGELINILGGCIKRLIPGQSQISLPETSSPTKLREEPASAPEARRWYSFDCSGEPVSVFIAQSTGQHLSSQTPVSEVETAPNIEPEIIGLISKDLVKIPPYPAVATKIAALLQKEDYGVEDLVNLVERDQSLSASVLRMAGSAAYAATSPVSSVRIAVGRLGARTVSALALASGLGPQVQAPGPLSSLKRRFWQDSLTSAYLCQQLASTRGLSADEAFTCGLLHDFGRVVTLSSLEQILATKPAFPKQPIQYWDNLVGKYHLELGLVMATRWGLSQLLREVITLHHDDLASSEHPKMLELVMIADQVVAIANHLPAVSVQDLETVTLFRSAAERELVARTLPLCPGIVVGFEFDDKGEMSGQSAIAPKRSLGRLKPISLEVTDLARPALKYQTVAIGSNVLVLQSPTPLALNRLVQLSLKISDRTFTLWANPQSCELIEGTHHVEVKPFALGGDSLRQWVDLLRE